MIIYFDFKTKQFNYESKRNGQSSLTTWKSLDVNVHLKDVSFGVVQHPFNPGVTSFRRKTFTPYKPTDMGGKDYGIAIKGTEISDNEYNNLVVDTNPVPLTIRTLFHQYGQRFYQSYPNLVKFLNQQDKMEQAVANPNFTGTRSVQASRKFPTIIHRDNTYQSIYFVPRPVFAMQILPYSTNCGILFDEKQSAKTWVEWHTQLNEDYNSTIQERYEVA